MSRDPKRIAKVLDLVGQYWYKNPDLRLGQIVEIMAIRGRPVDAFYMEDEKLIEHLERELNGEPPEEYEFYTSPDKPPAALKNPIWISVCSAHFTREADCPMCGTGLWHEKKENK